MIVPFILIIAGAMLCLAYYAGHTQASLTNSRNIAHAREVHLRDVCNMYVLSNRSAAAFEYALGALHRVPTNPTLKQEMPVDIRPAGYKFPEIDLSESEGA